MTTTSPATKQNEQAKTDHATASTMRSLPPIGRVASPMTEPKNVEPPSDWLMPFAKAK
jgi:hypothetical protein